MVLESFILHVKQWILGTGELAQQLRVPAALPEDQLLFAAPTSAASQPPVTPWALALHTLTHT